MAVVHALIAGFFVDDVLESFGSSESSIEVVHRYVLFVMLLIAGYRFFMYKGFLDNVLHYLNLPYSRQQLIFVLGASTLFNVSQIALACFFTTFTISVVMPAHGFIPGVAYLAGCLVLVAGINFLTLLFRELQKWSLIVFVQLLLVIAGIALVSSVSPLVFIQQASSYLFDNLVSGDRLISAGILVVFIALAAIYAEVLRRYTYMDDARFRPASTRKTRRKLMPTGRVSSYLVLVSRLLVRNRYTRQQMFSLTLLTALFSIQLLVVDTSEIGKTWIIFGLFLGGGFLLQFGPLMYAFEGQYFDGLLAQNFDLRAYLMARVLFLLLITLAYFVLLMAAFLFLTPAWVPMLIAMTAYSLGVHIFAVLIAGLYVSRQSIDLDRSVFRNYSTFTPAGLLMGLFVFLLPVSIQWIAGNYNNTLIVLGSIGVVGIALHVPALNYVSGIFEKKKYTLAENLRTHT